MTEQVNESGLRANEAGGSPIPSVPSTPAGDQLPSTPTGEPSNVAAEIAALKAEVKGLKQGQETLPDTVERLVQGTKDRGFRVLRGIDPNTLELFSQYLKQFDGDVGKATRELRVDLMLQGESPSPVTVGTVAAGGTAATDSDMSDISVEILTEAEIAFNDPGYEAFVGENAGRRFTKEEWRTAVNAFAFKRVKQLNAPPGSIVAESGLPPAPANLQQAYDKEFAALKGSRNVQGLLQLKNKYRALGLNV